MLSEGRGGLVEVWRRHVQLGGVSDGTEPPERRPLDVEPIADDGLVQLAGREPGVDPS